MRWASFYWFKNGISYTIKLGEISPNTNYYVNSFFDPQVLYDNISLFLQTISRFPDSIRILIYF